MLLGLLLVQQRIAAIFFGEPHAFLYWKSDHVEILARRGLHGCDCYASSHDFASTCGTLISMKIIDGPSNKCLNHKPKWFMDSIVTQHSDPAN